MVLRLRQHNIGYTADDVQPGTANKTLNDFFFVIQIFTESPCRHYIFLRTYSNRPSMV